MRPLILAALLAALLVAPAHAHLSPNSRVHQIRHVAVEVYGPGVCGDTMSIPITRKRNLTYTRMGANGKPREHRALGLFSWDGGRELPYTGCRIEVNDQRWTTHKLCILVAGHEVGHAAGRKHVARHRIWNVMAPMIIRYWRPCERFR